MRRFFIVTFLALATLTSCRLEPKGTSNVDRSKDLICFKIYNYLEAIGKYSNYILFADVMLNGTEEQQQAVTLLYTYYYQVGEGSVTIYPNGSEDYQRYVITSDGKKLSEGGLLELRYEIDVDMQSKVLVSARGVEGSEQTFSFDYGREGDKEDVVIKPTFGYNIVPSTPAEIEFSLYGNGVIDAGNRGGYRIDFTIDSSTPLTYGNSIPYEYNSGQMDVTYKDLIDNKSKHFTVSYAQGVEVYQ
ncbi:MAG: hypothetical protein IJX65_07905 [Alistipes sp.]|nr:hypothetical protein [Alistipes sp.]